MSNGITDTMSESRKLQVLSFKYPLLGKERMNVSFTESRNGNHCDGISPTADAHRLGSTVVEDRAASLPKSMIPANEQDKLGTIDTVSSVRD